MILAAEGTNGWDAVIILCGAGGMMTTMVTSVVAARRAGRAEHQAGAANRAVNNRPDDQPTIYELVGTAVDAATASQVAAEAAATDSAAACQQITDLDTKVGSIDRKVDHHLAWHQIDHETLERGTK